MQETQVKKTHDKCLKIYYFPWFLIKKHAFSGIGATFVLTHTCMILGLIALSPIQL
jgi:hypothetical membrane protein